MSHPICYDALTCISSKPTPRYPFDIPPYPKFTLPVPHHPVIMVQLEGKLTAVLISGRDLKGDDGMLGRLGWRACILAGTLAFACQVIGRRAGCSEVGGASSWKSRFYLGLQ